MTYRLMPILTLSWSLMPLFFCRKCKYTGLHLYIHLWTYIGRWHLTLAKSACEDFLNGETRVSGLSYSQLSVCLGHGQSRAASIKNRYIFCILEFRNDAGFTVQLITSLLSALASSLRVWWMNASPFSLFPAPVLYLVRTLLLKIFARGQQRFPALLPTTPATAGRSLCLGGLWSEATRPTSCYGGKRVKASWIQG